MDPITDDRFRELAPEAYDASPALVRRRGRAAYDVITHRTGLAGAVATRDPGKTLGQAYGRAFLAYLSLGSPLAYVGAIALALSQGNTVVVVVAVVLLVGFVVWVGYVWRRLRRVTRLLRRPA